MYTWKVETVEAVQLEPSLNQLQQAGWEIFAVIPTIRFENTKVVMATVSLPKQIEYNIVLRKHQQGVSHAVDGL